MTDALDHAARISHSSGKRRERNEVMPQSKVKRARRSPRKMSDLELGWVAGILEGEGCFSDRIQVTSTDQDVIQRLYDVTGVGRVSGPYLYASNKLGKKPFWVWTVTAKRHYRDLIQKTFSLLSSRRRSQSLSLLGVDAGIEIE